jgi:G3E family GTPase
VARGLRTRGRLHDYDARVDAATLDGLVREVSAVSGSCLCCDTFEGLLDELAQVPDQPGQVVVVETSGTTDTATLLTLLTGRGLRRLLPPVQLTVVDAQRFGRRDWQNVMERDQIATATHYFVSRTDVVADERRREVEEALKKMAPRALLAPPDVMAATLADLETWAEAPAAGFTPPLAVTGTSAGHATAYHFASLVIDLPGPVDSDAFTRFLAELPPEILRAKGIVALRDLGGEKRSFQKVDAEIEISPCTLADPDEVDPVAVFVGPSIPALTVRTRLARLFSR